MSQAAIKPARPTVPLSQSAGTRKSSRPSTPQTEATKTDSRASTPAQAVVIEESPVKKDKRRASNDSSQKVRTSPKAEEVVNAAEKKEATNGKQEHTNGTNGNHAAPPPTFAEVVADKSNKGGEKVAKKEEASKKKDSEDEMEPLVVEAEAPVAEEPPQTPKASQKPTGRVLTPRQAPPSGRAKPFKAAPAASVTERLQSTSTIVNLSTVSEQSAEASTPPASDDSSIQVPSRISGRRSVRPLKDIQLTYRSSPANDSSSSLNATVGSQIHNDTINTPYLMKVGAGNRKRRETEFDHEGFIDSPSKRSRIDFSGFLGYVTTPVTLLKNRLSRVGLTSSTPRKLDTTDEANIADVTATTELTSASIAEEAKEQESPENMEVVDLEDPIVKGPLLEEAEQESSNNDSKEKTNRSFCVVM